MKNPIDGIKYFSWFVLSAFLIGSITHVAWMYHYYDTTQNDMFSWVIPYCIAASTDLLVMLLTYAQAKCKIWNRIFIWFFIFTFALLSYYLNWVYSMLHNPAYNGDIWSTQLTWFTVGTITPILVSGMPIFVFAFSLLHIVLQKINLPDEDLTAMVTKLQTEKEQKARIAQLKRETRNATINNAIDDVTGIFKRTVSSLKPAPSTVSENPKDEIVVPSGNVSENPKDETVAPSGNVSENPKDETVAPSDTIQQLNTVSENPKDELIPLTVDRNTDELKPVASTNGHSKEYDFSDFLKSLQ